MKKALLLAAMSVALVVASRPAFAHHAGGNYDTEHPVTLTGTVTEYRLVSPHTQIFFDVKDEQGNVTSWVAAVRSSAKAVPSRVEGRYAEAGRSSHCHRLALEGW